MGCDWSVLSHPNLSVPAAALSLSLSVCLCLWLSLCLSLLASAAAAAAAASCYSLRPLPFPSAHRHAHAAVCLRIHYYTHHTPPPSPPPRRKPVPRTVTAARSYCCCCQASLPTFLLSLPGAAELRVARSSSTAEKERPPATYHLQRQPDSRAAGPRITASSSTQHLHPSPPTSHHRPAANQLAVARPSLRPLHARHPRCWSVSTSPALDRLPPSSLARARLQ